MTATGPLPPFHLERIAADGGRFLGRVYSAEKKQTALVWARPPRNVPTSQVLNAVEQDRAWFDPHTWRLVIR